MTTNSTLILIDYKDLTTGYEECPDHRSANMSFENLKSNNDIEFMRVRYVDGTETCWENPDNDLDESID